MGFAYGWGLGVGVAPTTAGKNIIFPRPCAGFTVSATGGDVTIMPNAVIVDGSNVPVTTYPAGATNVPVVAQVNRFIASDVTANGILVKSGTSIELKGFADFNAGPQLVCLAAVGSGTLTGGMTNVATG